MPIVQSSQLDVSPAADDTVEIAITYTVRVTEFERNLAGLGLVFQSLVTVQGVDDPSTPPQSLVSFPLRVLDVPSSGPLTFTIDDSITRPRSALVEDPFGDDEIQCAIRIRSIGIPPALSREFQTNMVSLEKFGLTLS